MSHFIAAKFSSLLKQSPPLPLSRRRAVAGIVALLLLASVLIGNMVAISVFTWEAATSPRRLVALLAFWGITFFALFFVWRMARFLLKHWPAKLGAS
jgi:hypothetical protein